MAWAANRMFWVAADASCTQNSRTRSLLSLRMSPQTTIAKGASLAILALGVISAIFCNVALFFTTMKCHGWILTADGAAMPARRSFSILLSSTGLS